MLIFTHFSKIGYDKIVALQYNRRNIDAEILKEEELSNPAKVRQLLDRNVYGIGKRIPFSIIKQDMQEAFDSLGINRIATAANLRAIFAVKDCKVRLNNQREHGYIILGLTNMNYPALSGKADPLPDFLYSQCTYALKNVILIVIT